MEEPINILWRKESSTDLFMELFGIGCEIPFRRFEEEFQSAKSDAEYQKDSLFASELRDCGKKSLTDGQYFEAMKHFNNALTLAETNSIELSLAYANRSVCFYNLNMYEECLTYIDLAKKSDYPEPLISKLEACASDCEYSLRIQRKAAFSSIRVPSLSFNEHKTYKGVADCLKIEKTEDFGDGVITTHDLEIGQTILVEPPYSIIPTQSITKGRDRCRHCFREGMNFIPCSNCPIAIFCDKNCLEKSFHKFECKMPVMAFRKEKETFDLVLKAFCNVNAAYPAVESLMKTVELALRGENVGELTREQKRFDLLLRLHHNHENQSSEQLKALRTGTACVYLTIKRVPGIKYKYPTKRHQRFLQHLIFHLFHLAEHSLYLHEYLQDKSGKDICELKPRVYAIGLYPFGCHIKHSCVPNVLWLNDGDRLVCKVIRPINSGQQIFRSYS